MYIYMYVYIYITTTSQGDNLMTEMKEITNSNCTIFWCALLRLLSPHLHRSDLYFQQEIKFWLTHCREYEFFLKVV